MRALKKSLNNLFSTPKKRAPDNHRKAREAAKPLIQKLGIELEKFREGGFNVWPPKTLADHDDPFEGDHYANDWDDVLERVQAYEKLCGTAAI